MKDDIQGPATIDGRRPRIGFDLDGVLIQNPFRKGVEPHVRRLVGTAPELATLTPAEARARIDTAVLAEFKARMQAGRSCDAYDWDDIYGLVSRSFGGPEIPDVAGLVRHYSRVPGMIALLPAVREALDGLRAAGRDLVAVTNGLERYQRPVLEALGIDSFFTALFSPDRTGFAKPEAGMFEAAAPLDVFVGDMLEYDIYGANAVGVASVLVAPALPASLRDVAPWQRPRHADFRPWLERSLETSIYRRMFPEATADTCMPAAAVLGMAEVGETVEQLLDLTP